MSLQLYDDFIILIEKRSRPLHFFLFKIFFQYESSFIFITHSITFICIYIIGKSHYDNFKDHFYKILEALRLYIVVV
ncbi:hypothetical protein PFBG_04209 [Plasmodium falciparum 7G8]|uniref:Uncharacterized protein n=3 Tax=Plasmodium falciparum TaxID=5833 RepID=A0A024W2J2_PLAFA|nr:hypothetical protein PFTANZ_04122 [Plasmodium falciparum Tanzania (2000708)]ETW41320.1 hypothetical protein PFNF135_04305 [Plasmodium falciparum NF135/5.C10]EUR67529.1 hypothetical protein PFBG_04209 [Plasmodium falciparum 7G8]